MAGPLIKLEGIDHRVLNRGPFGSGVLRVAAVDAKTADLLIYGDIGVFWGEGIGAADVAKELDGLDVETINVRINSPGGSVFEGVTIYNTLAQHAANVVVHIDGVAASIASIIAMAGDEIRIAEAATMMIHKPLSFAFGQAPDLRKEADVLDTLEESLIDIYEARTGLKRDDLAKRLAAETWMRGQEAVDAGFADTVVKSKTKKKPAASALLASYRNTPADLLQQQDGPAIREFERMLRDAAFCSNADAKRIAALASRAFGGHRDDGPGPRDEDETAAETARRLAAGLRSLIR